MIFSLPHCFFSMFLKVRHYFELLKCDDLMELQLGKK